MTNTFDSLPSNLVAAHALILAERAARLSSEARAAQAQADLTHAQATASSADALIAQLRLELEKLRRTLYGVRSERKKRLLDQLEMQLEDAEADANEDELAAERAAASTTVKSFERKRPARKPFPEHLPRERIVIAAPQNCPCCGSTKLSKLGEDVTETLEVVPRQWKVIQTVRERFSCRQCEAIAQPPAPFHVTPRGFAGPKVGLNAEAASAREIETLHPKIGHLRSRLIPDQVEDKLCAKGSANKRAGPPSQARSLARRTVNSPAMCEASYALKLTATGAKAIAVDDAAEPEDVGREGDALANRDQAAILSKLDAKDAQPAEAIEPGPAGPSAPRGGSKLARVIALLERDHGATIEELIAATGWLAHTTRAALTGLRKRGYAVAIDRSDDKRGSFYRIPAGETGLVEEPANSEAARRKERGRSEPQAHPAA